MTKENKKEERKFDFKEFLENSVIEDRKKALNKLKPEWRDLMLTRTDKEENKK